MEEQLVSFETAKLAKKQGFKERCHYFFNEGSGWKIQEDYILRQDKTIEAPSQSLLQKWLREVYNTHLMVEPFYNEQKVLVYGFDLITERIEEETIVEKGFKTYEEALEVGLQEALKLIEIVKEK